MKLITEFTEGNMNTKGHGNRVCSVQFLTDDPKVFVSGGWDGNFILWDSRQKECVSIFEGVRVSGDAFDFKGFRLLVG